MTQHALLDGAAPFTLADALAAGLSREEIRRALRRGHLRRPHRGVYVPGALPDTLAARARGLCLLAPHAVVSHESAAEAWGVDVVGPGEQPTGVLRVTVPPEAAKPQVLGVRVTQAALDPEQVWQWEGVAVTAPGRTAADLIRGRDLVEGVVVADAMSHRWPRVLRDLADVARALPAGSRGAAVLRAVAGHAEWRAESPMESRLRMLLVLAGLPRPVAQHDVHVDGRFVARLDLAYPDLRLGLEYDGVAAHPVGLGRDRRRSRALLAAGWAVLHFTVEDVRSVRRDALAAEVAALRSGQERRRAMGWPG